MLKPISINNASRLACLVIGPPGIGKTSLIRTLCGQMYDTQQKKWIESGFKSERVFVLSAEGGLLCVRDLLEKNVIQGFEINSQSDFIEAQNICVRKEFEDSFDWLFIDSLTEISSRCCENITANSTSFKDWLIYDRQMTSLIKAFRDMKKCNVVFTCLEEERKDSNGIPRATPAISGNKLRTMLVSYFDEVLYMEKKIGQKGIATTLFSTALPIGIAKDRSGKLKEYELPNLLLIKEKIFGG